MCCRVTPITGVVELQLKYCDDGNEELLHRVRSRLMPRRRIVVVTVSGIAVGGRTYKAGLKVGEVVTKADGRDVTKISRDGFCDIKQGTPKTITTASGETYDVSIINGFFGGGANE